MHVLLPCGFMAVRPASCFLTTSDSTVSVAEQQHRLRQVHGGGTNPLTPEKWMAQ